MCPVTDKYIYPYIDKNKHPIKIDNRVIADVVKNAHEVLGIANRGAKIIFPDIKTIYATLVHQLEQQKKLEAAADLYIAPQQHRQETPSVPATPAPPQTAADIFKVAREKAVLVNSDANRQQKKRP